MGLWDEVGRVWQEGTPCYSKPMELMGEMAGINFTFNESSEMKALKEKVEEKTGSIVYYATCTETVFGKMVSFFVVTPYENDWEQDCAILKKGYTDAYCYFMEEENGEYGSIGFEVANGGLIRTE